jgi:hypothetical protein
MDVIQKRGAIAKSLQGGGCRFDTGSVTEPSADFCKESALLVRLARQMHEGQSFELSNDAFFRSRIKTA